jgi:solute carrier family 25 protein 38
LGRTVPGAALYFGSIYQYKYLLLAGFNRKLITVPLLFDAPNKRISVLGDLLIGFTARSTVTLIMMPMTVVKTRFESLAYRRQYETVLGALSAIWSAEGVRGLWRGWGATIMRDAPYSSLQYAILGRLKRIFGDDRRGWSISSLLAGASATLITNPFDTARTRIQLKPTGYPSMLIALTKIAREEGMAGFYRGAMPRMVKKSLSSAIGWVIFEELMHRNRGR